jgi:hypothetical protein
MAEQWTSSAQKTMPSAAAAVLVTGPNSGWVELSASGPAVDSLLTGIYLAVAAATFHTIVIDIGVGALGSEVAICTMALNFQNGDVGGYLPVTIPGGVMPAGVRVVARVRSSGSNAYRVALTYLPAAFVGSLQTTTQPMTGTAFVTLAVPATAWSNSPWVELIASTSTAIVLSSIATAPSGNHNDSVEIEIGVGASGAEVPTALMAYRYEGSGTDEPFVQPWPHPFDNIGAGARVSARARTSRASSFSLSMALNYWAKPL